MADKITSIKIKQKNGSYTTQIPVSVSAQNVQWDGSHSLLDILGSVDVNVGGKGNVQHQFDDLYQNIDAFTDDINSEMTDFTNSTNQSITNFTNSTNQSIADFTNATNQHLSDVLGNISTETKGTVQAQMDKLQNDMNTFHTQMAAEIGTDVSDWLQQNVTPAGSMTMVDNSLTISDAAADAKAVGDALTSLNGSLGDIRTPNGINLIDESILKSGSGISYDGLEYVGTADAFKKAFTTNNLIPVDVDIEDNTKRYTLSFKAYTNGNASTTGNGLQAKFRYSDGTSNVINVPNSTSEWRTFSLTSGTDLTKSIVGVYFDWGSAGTNVFHVKELMLNSGTTARDYVPYYTANDRVARASISQIDATVDTMEETLKDVRNIIEHTPTASGTQTLRYPMKAGTTYAITTTGQVTLVLRDANGTELENTGTLYRDRVNYFTPSYDAARCSYWTSLTTDTMRIEEVGTIEYDTRQNTKDVFYLKSGVPSYFESMVSSAASQIREKMNAAGRDGDAFIFITDIHWPSNKKNSPYLCRYIMEHTNVPFIICGGDILTQTTRSSAISQITATVQAFTFKNKFFAVAFGNHDDNWNGYGDQHNYPVRYLDISDEYALFGKQCDGKVTWLTTTEMSFYFDNVTTKTRYFVLDTGDDGNTGAGNRVFSAKNELATALSEVQSGWHIIFVMHIVTYGQIDSWISPLLDAYNARTSFDGHDFTNAVGEVVLIIGGHTHKDENKSTTGGIPIIVTACDAASLSEVEGIKGVDVSGTTNEQCFDTVVVNYSDRVIDCIRVGYGQSRQFTY